MRFLGVLKPDPRTLLHNIKETDAPPEPILKHRPIDDPDPKIVERGAKKSKQNFPQRPNLTISDKTPVNNSQISAVMHVNLLKQTPSPGNFNEKV